METRRRATDDAETGTLDVHYNLISVIYHALHGAETYDQYAADAERSGDRELSRFLRDVQVENRRRAERAKELLYERLGEQDGRVRAADGSGFGERERRRAMASVPAAGAAAPPLVPPAQTVPAAQAPRMGAQRETVYPPAVAPRERGLAAGQDARNAGRSFEEVEPELRRDYEAEHAGSDRGDPWDDLREQVRAGFAQARQVPQGQTKTR